MTPITKSVAYRLGRPLAFLIAGLIVLYVVYGPNTTSLEGAGDVHLYRGYAQNALAESPELPREYPPLATVLFVVPYLVSPEQYMLVWTLWAATAAWLILVVVDHLSGNGWWLFILMTLGAWGTAAFRFDVFVVLITVLAFAAGTRRRWTLAQVLLALGVAIKLYPIILMPVVVVWQWRETRRLPFSSMIAGATGVLAAIGGMWVIDPAQLANVFAYHGQRPMEIESLGASLAWLWRPSAASVEFSFGSFNLISPAQTLLVPALSGVTVLLLLAVYGWFFLGRAGPAAAWALTLLVSIATSKVFSTQYLLWPLPFVVIALGAASTEGKRQRLAYAGLWVIICAITGLVYPLGFSFSYDEFSEAIMPSWLMIMITIRNALWLAACVFGLWLPVRHVWNAAGTATLSRPPEPRSSPTT